MSDRTFPTLPGLQYPIGRAPIWEVERRRMVSGRQFRLTHWSYPQWRYTLNFEFLQAKGSEQEFEALAGLFNLVGGGFDNFRWTDPHFNAVTDFQFGIGDGATRQFALTRQMGGFVEPVGYASPTAVKVNDAPTTAYALLESRVVEFTTAPIAGASLKWSGSYSSLVVFEDDSLSAEEFMHRFFQAKSIKLLTDKK